MKFGMLKEELKSRSKIDNIVFSLIIKELAQTGRVVELGTKIAAKDFQPTLNEKQKKNVELLLERFRKSPFETPSVKDSMATVGEDVFNHLLESEQLIKVSPDVVFTAQSFEEMVQRIREELHDEGEITIAEVRDTLNTTRKYALALMEYLDSIGVTVRQGDVRRLRN